MHMVMFGAFHVILLAVVAFFVLFAASRASGFVKILGNVLGYLLLVFSVLVLVCHVLMIAGLCPHRGIPYDHMWMMKDAAPTQQIAPAPGK